jgi:hypothetical protein
LIYHYTYRKIIFPCLPKEVSFTSFPPTTMWNINLMTLIKNTFVSVTNRGSRLLFYSFNSIDKTIVFFIINTIMFLLIYMWWIIACFSSQNLFHLLMCGIKVCIRNSWFSILTVFSRYLDVSLNCMRHSPSKIQACVCY